MERVTSNGAHDYSGKELSNSLHSQSRSSFRKQQPEKQNAEGDNRDIKGCRIVSVGTRKELTIERTDTEMDSICGILETGRC